MSFKWIDYGRYIIAGSDLYHQGNYLGAKEVIAKAVEIDDNDFVANFWRLRIAVRLREYMEAENAAQQCLKIAPDLAEHLVNPWQEALKFLQGETEITWDDFEQETDKWLEHYQWHREFSQWNIIGIALLVELVIPFIYVYLSHLVVAVIYYRKSRLIANFWLAGRRSIIAIKELFFEKDFGAVFALWILILIGPWILLELKATSWPQQKLLTGSLFAELTVFWIVAPITEEMFFRGMIFSFLRKHIAFWAYPVVSVLFYFFHGDRAAEYHFIVSWFFCWTYAKYGGLIAPIMCHIVLNTPHVGGVLLSLISLKN